MRKSGILMPIFSLPNKYGIGTFGKEAYQFIDFLKKANQKIWQVLPLGPTSYGDSPYQTFSSFAGNPYYIDLEKLVADNLLMIDEISYLLTQNQTIDYAALYENRFNVLRIAYSRFIKDKEYEQFCHKNKKWLDDYALFMSLKQKHNGLSWHLWEVPYKYRDQELLNEFISNNEIDISFWKFIQFTFYKQWYSLKKYANYNDIQIIGDMPIYVAYDSTDVWVKPELWQLDEKLLPKKVAGVPPDYFSKTGQLWGNPLYDYEKMSKTKYSWWIKRIESALKMYDIIRIDHFRGFESYYAIPYGDKTAEFGKWEKGPGLAIFDLLKTKYKELPIIAEDLGIITKEVEEMLELSGFPGMKVLQFGFDPQNDSTHAPHNHHKNSVVYTGTHDNLPILGWFSTLKETEITYLFNYLDITRENQINKRLIRLCFASVADTVIIPIQDYLELGNEARINTPSTLGNNWTWRLDMRMLSDELIDEIKQLTLIYKR